MRVTGSGSRLEILKSVVFNIPAPVAVLLGPEHRHELVNEYYKQVSGGGREVTGLTARDGRRPDGHEHEWSRQQVYVDIAEFVNGQLISP